MFECHYLSEIQVLEEKNNVHEDTSSDDIVIGSTRRTEEEKEEERIEENPDPLPHPRQRRRSIKLSMSASQSGSQSSLRSFTLTKNTENSGILSKCEAETENTLDRLKPRTDESSSECGLAKGDAFCLT